MAEQAMVGRSGARWLAVVFLSLLAGVLLGVLMVTPAPVSAQTRTGTAGGSNTFAIAGQLAGDAYGLYLIDLQAGTICVYQYTGGEHALRLVAARTFVYDRQLDEYNSDKPSPKDVAEMVAKARKLKDTTSQP